MCKRLDDLVAKPWVDGQGRRIVTPATMEAIEAQKGIILDGHVEGIQCIARYVITACWLHLSTSDS